MQRFIESSSFASEKLHRIEVPETKIEELAEGSTNQLTESILREKKTSIWEVPISKYDEENANGRSYPKALWERVLTDQKHLWEGSPMLTNHPADDGDGDPADICGVWVGARMGEGADKYVYGHLKPSGSLGKDLEEHLINGLRAGTSSSGFGELMEDGSTVDPSTFEIERLSDWVLTPSQGTYFTYDGVTHETKNDSDEDRYQEKENASGSLGESAKNKPESVVKENETMKLTKLEEKKFRRDMTDFLESASSLENPQDRLAEFEEILTYFEEGASPDLRESVEKKIEEETILIKKRITEGAILEKAGIPDLAEFQGVLTAVKENAVGVEKDAKDWKGIAKVLSIKLKESREELHVRPTTNYTEHLRKTIKALHAKNRRLFKEDSAEGSKALQEVTISLTSSEARVTELNEEIKTLNTESGSFQEQIARLQKRNSELETSLKESTDDFEGYRALAEAKPKMVNPTGAMAKYLGFREGDKVDNYWADLVVRHGESIKTYESKIRDSKTLREAQAVYFKILPILDESREIDDARIPESVSISLKERKGMFEDKGIHLEEKPFNKRIPKGWQ